MDRMKGKNHGIRDTMTSTPIQRKSSSSGVSFHWHIGTYIRILPDLKKEKSVIEYASREIESSPGEESRAILELKIPDDADPSFSLNSDTGILKYEYDKVFDADATQSTVFEVVAKDKILGAFDGINSTVFAFGQTGSGKTYTVFGGDSFQERGLIPRSIACLFKEYRAKKNLNFSVRCRVSFTEVYKETVYDLLDQKKKTTPLEQWTTVQVLEGDNGLTLRNVNVFDVESEDDALSLFFLGSTNRHTFCNSIHDKSSRSHAIFTMIVESKGVRTNGKMVFTSGKINLVDLAGSERIHKGLNSKETIDEAKSINLALHYLENVIVSLRDHRQNNRTEYGEISNGTPNAGHVPYRNSMLTNVLRDSLGGNCRSAFILNISSERLSFEETVSTCRFGQRLADVRVHVHANAEISLADQLKACKAQLRGLERRCLMVEEEKALLTAELASERQSFHDRWEPRTLTAQEKTECKQCVQNLFAAAKEAAALTATAIYNEEVNAANASANNNNNNETTATATANQSPDDKAKDILNSPKKTVTGAVSSPLVDGMDTTKATEEASKLVNNSQEELYAALEQMDRAVLIELSTALGGLVQTMYLEREKAKAEEHKKQQRKQRLAAEREARIRAKAEADQQEREKRHAERDEAAALALAGEGVGKVVVELSDPEKIAVEASNIDDTIGPTVVGMVPANAAGGGPAPDHYHTDIGHRSPVRDRDAAARDTTGVMSSSSPARDVAEEHKVTAPPPSSQPPSTEMNDHWKTEPSSSSALPSSTEQSAYNTGPHGHGHYAVGGGRDRDRDRDHNTLGASQSNGNGMSAASMAGGGPGPSTKPISPTPMGKSDRNVAPSTARSQVPRVMLSEETYQMLVRGDSFYVSNFIGIRSARHYFVGADLRGLGWRPAAAVASSKDNVLPFSQFDKVKIDDSQSKRGLYVITLYAMYTKDKNLVLEYQTPNGAKANKWQQALSFCVDKALGRI